MSDLGIKVTKAGEDISTSDIRKLLMSSEHSMLKYHSDNTNSVTINPGDTEKYVDFSHALGYVPAFIAYIKQNGKQFLIPSLPRGASFDGYAYAWADSSKVRCGYAYKSGAYNQLMIPTTSYYDYWDNHFADNGFILVGNKYGSGFEGAIRFQNISISQGESITSATLSVAAGSSHNGGGDVKIKLWGIDEDNTADFNGNNPMGRSKTDAVTNRQGPVPPSQEYFGIDVTNQIREITSRGGWSSGNALGFIYSDDGSYADSWIEDDYNQTIDSKLYITHGGNTTVYFRAIIFKDKIA